MPAHTYGDSFGRQAWRRLRRNKGAMAGLWVILLAVFAAVFAYYLAPDATPDANNMTLEISGAPPGFRVRMLALKKYPAVPPVPFWQHLLYGQPAAFDYIPVKSFTLKGDSLFFRRYVDEETSEPGATDLLHMVYALPDTIAVREAGNGMIAFRTQEGPWRRVSLNILQQRARSQVKERTFWLGTDKYGRDILSRIILGVRISLSVGLIAVAVSLSIGILLGALAGYFRGWIDDLVMWLINVVWSVPTLLLVFALTIALGKGFAQIFLAIGLTMWVSVARIIRGQVMSLREMTFIEAARALGYGHPRIITRHILPNILGPVLVVAANNFATAIVVEAGLSFLGIGIQPPMPSWGLMIQENYGFIITHNPFLAIAPGIAIMITVLAFNLLGNGLRDAMDMKGKL